MPIPEPQDNSNQPNIDKALAAAAGKGDAHAQAVARWIAATSRGQIRGDYHSFPGIFGAFVKRASTRLQIDLAKKEKLHQRFLRSQSSLQPVSEDTLIKDFLDVLMFAFYKGMLPSAFLANQLVTDVTYGDLVSSRRTFEPATQDRPWHLFPSRHYVEMRIKEEKLFLESAIDSMQFELDLLQSENSTAQKNHVFRLRLDDMIVLFNREHL